MSVKLIIRWLSVAFTSWIEACIWSLGETVIELIVIEEFGKSSYQAEYSAIPRIESCSVPHWISVLSLNGSTPTPPMPIQTAEYVGLVEAITPGTIHEALTLVTSGSGFCKSEATM